MPWIATGSGHGGGRRGEGEGAEGLARDYEVGSRIDARCQELGLLVRPIINMCVFSPPLTITEGQLHEMFDMLEQGIRLAAEDLTG